MVSKAQPKYKTEIEYARALKEEQAEVYLEHKNLLDKINTSIGHFKSEKRCMNILTYLSYFGTFVMGYMSANMYADLQVKDETSWLNMGLFGGGLIIFLMGEFGRSGRIEWLEHYAIEKGELNKELSDLVESKAYESLPPQDFLKQN